MPNANGVYSLFDHPPKVDGPAGDSLTDESFAEECDVNNIIKRYVQTGLMPHTKAFGFFEDISNLPEDLMAAQQTLAEAERNFMLLPSGIRSKFDNNPIALIQWLENPANAAEAAELFGKKAAPPEPGAPDSGKPPS